MTTNTQTFPEQGFNQETPDLILQNIRVFAPSGSVEHNDVGIQNGSLVFDSQGMDGAPVVDASELWLTQSLTDIHVHFRSPGQEWKEDIESGSRVAARGGVGCVVGMANTSPTLDQPDLIDSVHQKGREVGLIDYRTVGACSLGLRQEELSPMFQLAQAGVVGFSDDGLVIQNGLFMRRVLEYAKTLEKPVIVHAEDKHIRQNGVMHEGAVSWDLGLQGNPRTAEAALVARDIELAALTGGHVHIQHISTGDAVRLLRSAKERGVPVTGEACPHHFWLTDEAVREHGTAAKMAPPLREAEDIEEIRRGLADGTLDCIATDHAPHAPHEKERPFDEAPFGILGLQTLLPLTLDLVRAGVLTDARAIELLTTAPRNTMGMEALDFETNFAILAPNQEWTFDADTNESKSRNSPWWGQTLTGSSLLTNVNGKASWIADQSLWK